MPCYTPEPSKNEIDHSKVLAILEEYETGKLPDYYGNGYHVSYSSKIYQSYDEATELLYSILQNTDVSKYSLEMQIWWRDHQKHDKERIQKEMQRSKTEQEKETALLKLSPYERKLLGY